MSQFKGVVKLTEAQFNTLSTNGTITVGGVTYTYDPVGTLYVIGDSLSVYSSSEGGSAPANMVTTDTAQTITGTKTFSGLVNISDQNNSTSIRLKGNPVITDFAQAPFIDITAGGILSSRHCYINAYGIFSTTETGSSIYPSSGISCGLFGTSTPGSVYDWGYYRRTSDGNLNVIIDFNKLLMHETGDNIASRVSDGALISDQIIYCTRDSTDVNVTYQVGHLYKFNYRHNTWTATDITPSSSITPVTTITNQSTDSDIPSAKAVWDLCETKAEISKTFTNVVADTWVSDNTYSSLGFDYACEISIPNVTANDFAEVVFSAADSLSGNYCPNVLTRAGTVTIYSKVNTTITIPTIKIDKVLSYSRYNIQQTTSGDNCSLDFTTYTNQANNNYWVASTDDNNSQIIDIINE